MRGSLRGANPSGNILLAGRGNASIGDGLAFFLLFNFAQLDIFRVFEFAFSVLGVPFRSSAAAEGHLIVLIIDNNAK